MNTKQQKVLKNLVKPENKALLDLIKTDTYHKPLDFIDDGFRWISAIKENRMICSIPHVSASGMSRHMKFIEVARNKGITPVRYNARNFYWFMSILGYSAARNNRDCFLISGCGMDMVFNTNYNIIYSLWSLGFMSKKTRDKLSQSTPPVI